MILAGVFAAALFIGLIAGDWAYFMRLTEEASRYGCAVARIHEQWRDVNAAAFEARFGPQGVLSLPHGVARLFPQERRVSLRPAYRLFSLQFRTAWPIKGTIDLASQESGVTVICVKRVPWSSAILTVLWFALVSLGTLGFLVTYGFQGGFASLGGVLMGLGIAGLGLLVLAFGFVTVIVAYRLESGRLATVYEELRASMAGRVDRPD
jgi:hypothetical protein